MTKNNTRPTSAVSDNKFAAFFIWLRQRWLVVWYGFKEKKPRLANFLAEFGLYWFISTAVTVFQYLIFLFLPSLLGKELAATAWWWPNNLLLPYKVNGEAAYWHLLGYAILYDEAGQVVIGGGLGYMISFAIGTLFAQIVNFPLQRNVTYRSHGNPWWQAMWYVIAWLIINLFSNAINGLWHPIGEVMLSQDLYKLLDTLIMGTISLFLFFFIFKIIFPDLTAQAAAEEKKLEKMKEGVKRDKFLVKHEATKKSAEIYEAEKSSRTCTRLAEVKTLVYDDRLKRLEKLNDTGDAQKIAEMQIKCEIALTDKEKALIGRDKAIENKKAVYNKYGINK